MSCYVLWKVSYFINYRTAPLSYYPDQTDHECRINHKIDNMYIAIELARCRDYENIRGGFRIIDSSTPVEGDMIFFGCNEGFDLIGNPRLICGSDGYWIGAWPICAQGEYSSFSTSFGFSLHLNMNLVSMQHCMKNNYKLLSFT